MILISVYAYLADYSHRAKMPLDELSTITSLIHSATYAAA